MKRRVLARRAQIRCLRQSATFASLAGAAAPADRIFDGFDLSSTLRSLGKSPREVLFLYQGATLNGVRQGSFKIHADLPPVSGRGQRAVVPFESLKWELFNLDEDVSERTDLATRHPDVVASLLKLAEVHRKSVIAVEDQIGKRGQPASPQ